VNWLDFVLAIVIAFSVWRSFARGLTREVIGLVSVVVGILLAAWLYGTVGALVEPHVSSHSLANLCGFLIVFVGVMLLGSLVSWVLSKLLKITGLSFFDRLLGAAFGVVRGLLIAAALVMAMLAFAPEAKADAVANSRLAPYVIGAARVFVAAAPREMKDGFHKSYEQVKNRWAETLKKGIQKVPKDEEK
jgi:membrane protein required for colicin V production